MTNGMELGHEVEVDELPQCDFHPERTAAYDGRTRLGPWAYLCASCYKKHGVGTGTGRGQRLVLKGGETP